MENPFIEDSGAVKDYAGFVEGLFKDYDELVPKSLIKIVLKAVDIEKDGDMITTVTGLLVLETLTMYSMIYQTKALAAKAELN